MPAKRVNFKEVRESADFAAVLSSYGIEVIKDGQRNGQYKALCPFHDDQDPSMKVNIEKNIFNCFACGAGGNILDFVMKMDECTVREAALKLANRSDVATPVSKKTATSKSNKQVEKSQEDPDGVPYNKPLTFELTDLQTDHPFIKERGLTPEMINAFGLGIAKRGMMKNRLVFPIHNADGKLVAYCGRLVEGEASDDNPKYKQPPNFRKELELFNWHRRDRWQTEEDRYLILVESFLSVVKLHSWHYPVVSPMGRSLSKEQIAMIAAENYDEVVLLFDGDDPGRAAIAAVGRQLLDFGVCVTAPVVAEEFKPHRLSETDLDQLLI